MDKDVIVMVQDGQIVVFPESLNMGKDHNLSIMWHINGDGWRFTDAGISFYAPGSQLTNKGPQAGYRKFKWQNKNDDHQTYRYAVNLISDDGRPLVRDPSIINQGNDLI